MAIGDVLSPAVRARLARVAARSDPRRERLEACGWVLRPGSAPGVYVAEHAAGRRKLYGTDEAELVGRLQRTWPT